MKLDQLKKVCSALAKSKLTKVRAGSNPPANCDTNDPNPSQECIDYWLTCSGDLITLIKNTDSSS